VVSRPANGAGTRVFRGDCLAQTALFLALAAAGLASPAPVLAQPAQPVQRAPEPPAAAPVENSNLDAPLFYQLLLAEMQLRSGDTATGYQLLLDAARRSKDEVLFRRATDIALQAVPERQAERVTAPVAASPEQTVCGRPLAVQITLVAAAPDTRRAAA
jgi:hypothetical protein